VLTKIVDFLINCRYNNDMKVKLTILTLLCSLINNVTTGAVTGNISTTYKSDYFFRGNAVSSETIQTQLDASVKLSESVNASLMGAMYSPLNNTGDTYELTGAISSQFVDGLLQSTGGFFHREQTSGSSTGELFISAAVNVLTTPTVNVYYDTDTELYTYELTGSHTFNSELADLTVSAGAGSTELTNTTNRDYYTVGATAARKLAGELIGSIGLEHVDAENIDAESVVSVGLSLSF
jgi:hypothetical protein